MIKFTTSHHLIHWWKGTDSLKLIMYPPSSHFSWYFRIFAERILWKLIDPLFREHWVVHQRIKNNLIKFGISEKKIIIREDLPLDVSNVKRMGHEGFNVAYHYPGDRRGRVFKRWLYGMDIIEQLIKQFPKYNWIELDGTMDMMKIYPILDAYIRPTRHDGMPRIILECQQLNIPYWWDEDFKPSVGETYAFVEKVWLAKKAKKG